MTSSDINTVPRVLYLPNEADLSDVSRQIGVRGAFTDMHAQGLIRELGIYSFLYEYRKTGDKQAAQQRLLSEVEAFKPDILFWQHPDNFPLTYELVREVRRRGGNPLIAYSEGDPFDRFYKRLNEPQRALYSESDVFFTIALGEGMRLFQEVRQHPHFYHSPNHVDRERFGDAPDESTFRQRRYDAVMIGSIAYRLKGLLKHPGSQERIAVARGLSRLFGDRFASFGRGWPKGTNHCGFLPFPEQRRMLRSARMSVIWENFPKHTFYFSDRLPISLSAAVPHITSWGEGYDVMFSNVPGLFLADSVNNALDIAMYLRGLPIEENIRLGMAARDWVLENLEARVVFRNAFDICRREWLARRGLTA